MQVVVMLLTLIVSSLFGTPNLTYSVNFYNVDTGQYPYTFNISVTIVKDNTTYYHDLYKVTFYDKTNFFSMNKTIHPKLLDGNYTLIVRVYNNEYNYIFKYPFEVRSIIVSKVFTYERNGTLVIIYFVKPIGDVKMLLINRVSNNKSMFVISKSYEYSGEKIVVFEYSDLEPDKTYRIDLFTVYNNTTILFNTEYINYFGNVVNQTSFRTEYYSGVVMLVIFFMSLITIISIIRLLV